MHITRFYRRSYAQTAIAIVLNALLNGSFSQQLRFEQPIWAESTDSGEGSGNAGRFSRTIIEPPAEGPAKLHRIFAEEENSSMRKFNLESESRCAVG
jgi:hypothetical protein